MKTPSSRPASLPLQFASSVWVAILAMGLLGLGCASNNVNPRTAHRGTGYVDFYARNDTDLSWSIERLESDGDRKNVFFEFDPLQENILRLAFKPGHHRLSITIINRPILAQGTVELEVGDGQVIPVSVTLADAGTGQVLSKEISVGGTGYGRFGRRTRIRSQETQLLRILAEAGPALPYQTKSQMPYATASDPETDIPPKP
jgi:hypothetical protein